MSVKRIAEQPRVTMPFSEEAWNALDALGEKVDADLLAQDVRLTMGGEPTFVSVDDYQSAEWNTAAVGPTKRQRADELIRRLRDRFAPGGLLQYGQGKWYPGEPLPRWAFALYWRRDGVPIWRDDSLIAREAADHNPTAEDSQHLAERDCRASRHRGGLCSACLRGSGRPDGQTRRCRKTSTRAIRRSTTRVSGRGSWAFDSHLSKPAGFVLPVQRWTAQAKPGWLSEVWRTAPRPDFSGAGRFARSVSACRCSRCPTSPRRVSASRSGRPVRREEPLPDPRVTHPIGAYALRTLPARTRRRRSLPKP